MEGVSKTRKSGIVTIGLVLLMISSVFVEKSEAKFNVGCFVECIAVCVPFKNPFLCAADCGIQCLKKTPLDAANSLKFKDDSHQFCHLGCAISICPRFISKDNQGAEKVEKCANSCGMTCNKKYLSR